jgi:putative hydrolase of the HAD superfamily
LVRACRKGRYGSSETAARITNATSRLLTDLEKLNLRDEFDQIINSSVIDVAKPDAAIFHAALQALRVTPENALFVDDSAGHVRAAEALGIRGHIYQGAELLGVFLQQNLFCSQSQL